MFMVKIAIVTDDGERISEHFGRAMYYVVYDIQDGFVKGREMRQKTAHHTGGEPHQHGEGRHSGPEAEAKHSSMLSNVSDCEALIAKGMGMGAYQAITAAGLRAYVSDLSLAEEAARAYAAGRLDSHLERPH
jgi:predicted Fe-Mo cluster-binding NifX family protein